jgi:hypothetical protein
VRGLDLEPTRPVAAAVRAVRSLRYDSFESEPIGVLEKPLAGFADVSEV